MKRTKAQESRSAIERVYITMRHLFNRGTYKPMGISGESLVSSLLVLSPEIYGLVNDPEKIELDGLLAHALVSTYQPSGEEIARIGIGARLGLEAR